MGEEDKKVPDNGSPIDKQKTAEQERKEYEEAKAQKIKDFNENPDQFVDIKKLTCAVMFTNRGPAVLIGERATPLQLKTAWGILNFEIQTTLSILRSMELMKKQNDKRIITNQQSKQGFRKFLRGR